MKIFFFFFFRTKVRVDQEMLLMHPRVAHKGLKCVGKRGKKQTNHQIQPCECMHVCWKGQKGHKLKKVRHTCHTERSRLTVNANISLIFAGLPPLNGTDSNNCKHLGGLQALHLNPRGSSPGTGGPAQHKGCSERGDYLSSARRDVGTGILSDSFTLIIGTGWQDCESVDTYHKCFMENMTAPSKKKNKKKEKKKLSQKSSGKVCSSRTLFKRGQLVCRCAQQIQTIWPKLGAACNCRSVCAH